MNRRRHISANAAKKLENAGIEELRTLLDRTSSKLYQTELLLSVTQKISGLNNLSEILWTLIDITTNELGSRTE